MSRFQYLCVLVSIVIGLAISAIVQGWGILIRARREAPPYVLHLAWSVLGLLFMIQWWWEFWQYRDVTWHLWTLVAAMANAITLALFAYVLSHGNQHQRDPRDHYWDNRRWIFGLAAAVVVELGVLTLLVGQPLWSLDNLFRALGVPVLVTLATSANERVHVALAVVCYALFFGFIAVVWRPL